MKIVIATGGFDPIHSGHVKYLESARELGDKLIVGLNSDEWLKRKKGRAFMPFSERQAVLKGLRCVDEVVSFDDSDGSAIKLLETMQRSYSYAEIIFANGGDRTVDNIPEMSVKNVLFKFGVGGNDKANSSSWILEEWKAPKTERPWGWYRVLEDKKTYKIKELVVAPGKSLSMQRHLKRAEHWYVLKGSCRIETELNGAVYNIKIAENSEYNIGCGVWHRGYNTDSEPCHILEVQHGEICIEEDIERRDQ